MKDIQLKHFLTVTPDFTSNIVTSFSRLHTHMSYVVPRGSTDAFLTCCTKTHSIFKKPFCFKFVWSCIFHLPIFILLAQLKKIIKEYYDRVYLCEGQKWDLEHEVKMRDWEVWRKGRVWAEVQWPYPTFPLCEVEGILAFGCTPLIFPHKR
jgi:hypothetical protein